LKKNTSKKKQKIKSEPMHFISADGFDIYVGKNNTQNDYLTLKFANTADLWFHTKNIHGSHAIIKLGLDKDVPKSTIIEAAQLAAYYSKARNSSQVPVDYTEIKNVKKPSGAKPGMVIYDKYNTVYVTPEKPIQKAGEEK
jgi:predicted ribosome quality control (RQC) complex YloA/Tae2 family protein